MMNKINHGSDLWYLQLDVVDQVHNNRQDIGILKQFNTMTSALENAVLEEAAKFGGFKELLEDDL